MSMAEQAFSNNYWQQRANDGSTLASSLGFQSAVISSPFRQELDELVRSIIATRCRSRDLPAFEMACKTLGYEYDPEKCELYAAETVMVPQTTRRKIA
jgi:hypothetical protein